MQTKYSWFEVDRVDPPKRSPSERVSDFLEIQGVYDEATASEQASRCVQCPNPACVQACPQHVPIPELLALTADRRFTEAAQLLLATHTLPELFAHICVGGRRCESACVVGCKSEPLPTSAIARFLLDYAGKHGIAEPAPAPPNGQRVAVIGSGICGLLGADLLSARGYAVTVFDSYARPGGRIVNGLPGFRVDRALIERRVQLLQNRGVRFHMNAVYGEDILLYRLQQEFDATLIAVGRAEPIPLTVPGADLKGVSQAYSFLLQHTANLVLNTPPVPVEGKRVVVLGGGDTAMDTLRVALRARAKEVVCVYRGDAGTMPANQQEFRDAQEEGARFLFLAHPVAVLGDASGQVTHLRCVQTQLLARGPEDRSTVQKVPSSEFDVPVDVLLVAYGFAPPKLPREAGFGALHHHADGCLRVDDRQMTNLPAIFAGGSVVRGPAPLAQLVADTRQAALAIDQYLIARRGQPRKPALGYTSSA